MNDVTKKEVSLADITAEMKHARELREKLSSLKIVPETVNSNTVKEPVLAKAKRFANPARTDETQEKSKSTNNKNKRIPIKLDELTKRWKNWDKEAKKTGLDVSEEDKKKKQDPSHDKNLQKSKVLSTIKLPSNMRIEEYADKWVLVSNTKPEQRTNITDVMNAIATYNSNVEAVNAANSVAGAVQSSVDSKVQEADKKADGLTVNNTNGNIAIVGEALKDVKDVNGAPVFKPEDVQKVAEEGLKAAQLGNIKDPKLLEEINNRKKKNDKNAEEKQKKATMSVASMQTTR